MPGFYLDDIQGRVPSLPPMLLEEPPAVPNADPATPRPSYSQTPRQRSEERSIHFRRDIDFSLDDIPYLRGRIMRDITGTWIVSPREDIPYRPLHRHMTESMFS